MSAIELNTTNSITDIERRLTQADIYLAFLACFAFLVSPCSASQIGKERAGPNEVLPLSARTLGYQLESVEEREPNFGRHQMADTGGVDFSQG